MAKKKKKDKNKNIKKNKPVIEKVNIADKPRMSAAEIIKRLKEKGKRK